MKTKFSYLALTLLISTAFIYSANSVEVEYEDGVAVLTEDNFQDVLDDNEFVLVKFYAPWCGHCQALEPSWEKAAKVLKGVVKVGAVNMDAEQSVGAPYGIKGFPTIKYFGLNKKKGPEDYQGARDANGIVQYAIG